jgi:hypothetical protein
MIMQSTKAPTQFKNRVIVEITTSHRLTEAEAAKAVQLLLKDVDTQKQPIWASLPNVYAEKLRVLEYGRALFAILRKSKPRVKSKPAKPKTVVVTSTFANPDER